MSIAQGKIWDHYQTAETSVFTGAHPRLASLAREVASGSRILNVGVGDGFFEESAIRRGGDVHSLDPSEESVRSLANRFGDSEQRRFKVGLVESIPFPAEFFDVVVMSEVLEHLDAASLEQALQEVDRVLKPDGKFIGTVPADEDLSDNAVLCPCCDARFHRWGHQQSFSRSRCVNVLGSRFTDVDVQRAYFPDWNSYSWKGKLLAAAKLFFCKFGRGGANENWRFLARKRRV